MHPVLVLVLHVHVEVLVRFECLAAQVAHPQVRSNQGYVSELLHGNHCFGIGTSFGNFEKSTTCYAPRSYAISASARFAESGRLTN